MHENYDEELLLELVKTKQFRALRAHLDEMNEVDIAEFLDELEPDQQVVVFRLLPKDVAADVFTYLEDSEDQDICLDGIHVLLVEDNDLNMEIAQFILENAGATVTKAWNGQEAVDCFLQSEGGTYDIILMDIMMPVMDGLDAARCIRSLDRSDAKSVPIFAITANAFSDDKERSYKAGMNEHISKPIIKKDLLRIMKKYIPK